MKKIIIAVSVLFASTSLFAQKTKTSIIGNNEISINAGVGSPSGNFAKGDYADDKSGYAKAGFHINLSGIHNFNKNWGINVVIGYTQFDAKGLQSLVDGYKEDSGTDSTTLNTTNKSSSFSVLVGPVYKIPVCSKFSIHLRALGGYTNTTLAGFKVYYEDYLDNTVMTQKKATTGSFGFQAGAGVNYNVTDNISVLANVDYFTSKPKFNISYENYNVNSGRKIDTYNESISGINATLGIGFSF
ncbi:MAG: outer membrane beta-barrel protein [Ferruginibacter sp.]